jgi:hypothetical protein
MKYLFRFLVSSIIMFVCVYIVGLNIKKALLRLVIQILIGIFIYFVMNIEYIKSIIDLKKILNRRKEY